MNYLKNNNNLLIFKMFNDFNDDNKDINCIIKDNKLILSVHIDINEISNYFEYFEAFNNFKNNSIEDSKELLYIISKIKNKNNLENIFKYFNDNYAKRYFIYDFIKSKNINILLKIYKNIKLNKDVKNVLEQVIIEHINDLPLKEELEISLDYNLKFNIHTLNKKISKKTNSNYLIKFYIKKIKNIILNDNNIDEHHLGLNIYLYNNEIDIIYFDIKNKINKPKYLQTFKTLLKNYRFAGLHIIYNIKNKYCFDYIFEIYRNNINIILKYIKNYFNNIQRCENNLTKKNYIIKFIKSNTLKKEILNYYINDGFYKLNINSYIIINYLLNDDNISEDLIKKIILKSENEINNILLLELYEYFQNDDNNYNKSIKYNNIKQFVDDEYLYEYECIIINNTIINRFLNEKKILPKYENYKNIIIRYSLCLYKFIYNLYDSYNKIQFICLILSKKIIFKNLNLKKILNDLNYNTIKIFINKFSINILESFLIDIKNSNLDYIITTNKLKNHEDLFNKKIIFKTDAHNNKIGFTLTEQNIFNIIKYKMDYNDNNIYLMLFNISLYSIRYKYNQLLDYILKLNNNYDFKKIINFKYEDKISKMKYCLLDFAYTNEIIHLIKCRSE